MAFFKFRKAGDEPSASPAQPESVTAMRRRAKHRLLGAAALVLIGVIGFPLLFDKQPRPISVDTPIEIPDKNKAKPLSLPAAVVATPAPAAKAAMAILLISVIPKISMNNGINADEGVDLKKSIKNSTLR